MDIDVDIHCRLSGTTVLFRRRILPPFLRPPPPPSHSYREVHEAHPILHDLQLREQNHPSPAVAVHQVPLRASEARADTGTPAARRRRRKVSERSAVAAAAAAAAVATVVVVAVLTVYHSVRNRITVFVPPLLEL